MARSYPARPRSRTPFLITSYVAGPDGDLKAELPACCPSWRAPETCRVSVHHLRHRKCGPSHSLAVAQCRTHGIAFTLYPLGYAPYLRRPLLRLSPDGRAILPEPGPSIREWRGTLFEAAVDAQEGRAWSRSSEVATVLDRWWATQGRHLHRSASIVGVEKELAERVREAIAAVLSIGTLVLRELSRADGYRAIGVAVCRVLQRVRGGARRALRLSVCGHIFGLWGAPWRWDPARQVMERSPFSSEGTPPGG